MFDLDGYVDGAKHKISRIPNFDKDSVESLLGILAYLDENERKDTIQDINSLVDPAYTDHILSSKNPVLSFPSEEESKGDGIQSGTVMAGDIELYPFGLTCENLRESILSVARSGHGKTTLVVHFVDQLIKNKIHFMMPDWKNDYAFLARRYDDVLFLRWSDIAFNPLTNIPDGMDRRLWWGVVLDVLSHTQSLLLATPNYIIQSLDTIYEDKKGEITFKDLAEFLRAQNESSMKKKEYSDVAENRIYQISNTLDKVVNVRHGFRIDELFRQQVVIQMWPLRFETSSFLFQTFMMHEFYRRLHNQIRMNRKATLTDGFFLDNFVMTIMDEAHLSAYSGQEQSLVASELSPPPLTTFFSQSRELLMGTFALTQFPHLIMDAFKDNAGTKIIGNVVESNLQKDLASSIGLGKDEEKFIGKLQKGTWIVNVAGRTKPFVMKTPEVSKGDLVAEAEVLARSKPIITKLQMKMQEIESKMFLHQVEKRSSDVYLPTLPDDAWKILSHVFDNEFHYQQQITDALGISPHKMADVKKLLISKDLIRIIKFPVIQNVRAHLVLTPKTLEIFKTMGKSAQRISYWRFLSTNPGYEHRYFQFLIRRQHKKLGWTGSIERMLPNGRRTDIYEEKDGYRKVIEIETTTTDIENKVKVLDGYADELVLLYKEESSAQIAKSSLLKIKEIPHERIWVGLARDYVELLYSIIKERESSGNQQKSGSIISENSESGKPSGNKEDAG
ncbi:MAG: hypothetical protein KGI27_01540 [Thaumarchaeota archaeon]|nr:hypothetical protein [Nitrososphaerota archaeon]